jgi:hypothetical protein
MRARLEQMVAMVTRYPLAQVLVPPRFQPGLSDQQMDALERAHDVRLGATLRALYGATNGFTFFWKAPGDDAHHLIDRYNDSVAEPTTRIDWDMKHGVLIEPLERMLSERTFGDLFLTHRDESTMLLWAGRPLTDERAAASVRVFDRYLAEGGEDGAIGLLMLPDQDPRIVGITDSAMVDPGRPWMSLGTYFDLILAMGCEYGSRYEFTGIDTLPPGELTFTPEQIERFGRDIFRPL